MNQERTNVLLYVDDGYPESRDYDGNYVLVTERGPAVRCESVAEPRWALVRNWLRRLRGGWYPASA